MYYRDTVHDFDRIPIFYCLKKKEGIKIYNSYEIAEQESEAKRAVKIVNLKQVIFYIKHNCQPDFVWVGYNDKLVFYFDKIKTTHAWREWFANDPRKKI